MLLLVKRGLLTGHFVSPILATKKHKKGFAQNPAHGLCPKSLVNLENLVNPVKDDFQKRSRLGNSVMRIKTIDSIVTTIAVSHAATL